MRILKLHKVNDYEKLESPDKFRGLTLKSPALEILTDFNFSKPYVIESSTRVTEVEVLMKKAHVRLKFVIDKEDRFLGIVTRADLAMENLQKYIDAGFDLEDITAYQVMTPRTELRAFDYEELVQSTIYDVLTSLQMANLHHCLVFDKTNGVIRGLISASDFAKRLDIPVSEDDKPTFVTLYDTLVQGMASSG